jgi:hypothetical protein
MEKSNNDPPDRRFAGVRRTCIPDRTGGAGRRRRWRFPRAPAAADRAVPGGSSSDVIARIVAAALGPRLGTQVVVENRVGGSTIVGTDMIAKAKPDGYTIGLANTSTHAASYALSDALPFDPIKDFTPVAMIGSSPFLLLGSSGGETVRETTCAQRIRERCRVVREGIPPTLLG